MTNTKVKEHAKLFNFNSGDPSTQRKVMETGKKGLNSGILNLDPIWGFYAMPSYSICLLCYAFLSRILFVFCMHVLKWKLLIYYLDLIYIFIRI